MSNLPQKVYNVSGDYAIVCANGAGDFTLDAANIIFTGNVTQTGNISTVYDFITIAANNTGVITDMGLIAQINSNAFAGLRFDTTANTWQISSSVYANGAPNAAYANLAISGAANSTVAGSNTQVQFNQSGAFGASGNLTFDYATSALKIQGHEILGNIGAAPATPSNAVAIYNNTPGGGGTGVYVLSSSVNDELVSKSKAIAYAIIF